MNKSQKIIWTIYLLIIVFSFLQKNGDILLRYLVFGWIPFLIAHFIWREKKS